MGLTFQMSPILTQAERAAWAEALSSWCLWGNPRSLVLLEGKKGQKTGLKRKEGPEHAGLIGCVKIFPCHRTLGHWESICKCHVEGREHPGCMWRMTWRRECMHGDEFRRPHHAVLFSSLGSRRRWRCLPCYKKLQELLGIIFSVFSSGQHEGSLSLLCSPSFFKLGNVLCQAPWVP